MASPNIPFLPKLSLRTIKIFGEIITVNAADESLRTAATSTFGETGGVAAGMMTSRTKEIMLFGRVIAVVDVDNAVHESDDHSSSGLVRTVKNANAQESEASNMGNNNGPVRLKRQNPNPVENNARAKRQRIKLESWIDLGAPWPYKKRLQYSDVDGSSRFLVSKDYIRASVLKSKNEALVQGCQTKDGTEVVVRDADTKTEHTLVLKTWATTSFVLTSSWTEKFVRRRKLEAGDVVGLRWDEEGSMFHFKLLEKASDKVF